MKKPSILGCYAGLEKNYDFRRRMDVVHKPGRRNPGLRPDDDEVPIDESWHIAIAERCPEIIVRTAKDLQDYLSASMGVSLHIIIRPLLRLCEDSNCIILCRKKDLPPQGKGLKAAKSCRIRVSKNQVLVCGFDERGTAQGSYFIEDLMNLREAPFLKLGETLREPRFSPRMVHSGWGLDQFPDAHLSAVAHAGMDAILLYAKGVDTSTQGHLDFNGLIRRAKLHGLDVYFYSYLKCWKHPEDENAEEVYDRVFGSLFEACPEAKGIVFVGESCEFPSKDERTTGLQWDKSVVDGIPLSKPSPGWWPCRDYPAWVAMIKKVVRKWSPQADIVFWTYNWGYAPEKERIELINSIPKDISLLVTFEMFDQIRRGGAVNPVMDYTISYPGPGKYFASEAKAASRRGIRLYAMCNTAGCTWDFGVTPYEPFPQQWAKRHEAILEAKRKWGLAGLMESHHFGFYPSFIAELAKWNFWKTSPSQPDTLKRIAIRDFGKEGAAHALKAWNLWSEAVRNYIPTNEDQYGPNRVGPSYPLIFHPDITRTFTSKEISMPCSPSAHNGSAIVKTFYHPYENAQQSPAPLRIRMEIRQYRKARALMEKGLCEIRKAVALAPAGRREDGWRQTLLAGFISNTLLTTIHVKEWWALNQRLFVQKNRSSLHRLLDKLLEIAAAEIENAKATIPIVERDSRLGWEPSMEYMCDKAHLEWKIRQVRHMVDNEISAYRRSIDL